MAHLLFGRRTTKIKEFCQRFNYLLILDFEATCQKDILLKPQEIIEFPCLAVSTDDWQIKNVFHEYIKPRINPVLTPFCTDLTGIMQDTVDNQPHFPKVFNKFNEWLLENQYLHNDKTSAFVTCGDWDLKVMLPSQCALDNLTVPNYFRKWIDLKKAYCEANDYYPRSLKDMLIRLRIPLEGKLHSGIHDTRNMCKIVKHLGQQNNIIFDITSSTELNPVDS